MVALSLCVSLCHILLYFKLFTEKKCVHGLPICVHGLPICVHGLPICVHGLPIRVHGLPICVHGFHRLHILIRLILNKYEVIFPAF
jgi:hypothetical protein